MSYETLDRFFSENKKQAIAFSGGVDSSFLLYEAVKHHSEFKAYYVKTQFQPATEMRSAIDFAKGLGVELDIIELDILSSEIVSNPEDRCYLCKKRIFDTILNKATKDGISVVVDGTNASDMNVVRPGIRALKELGIRSPLKESDLTKDDIRKLSKDAGLITWNKPSYSCLATSIPYGEIITPDLLCKIEQDEKYISDLGLIDFRVRIHNGSAVVKVDEKEIEKAMKIKDIIETTLSDEYDSIVIERK